MDHDFTLTWRPTFEDPRETSPVTQEHAVGDVVEPASALGVGLYAERFDQPAALTRHPTTRRHDLNHGLDRGPDDDHEHDRSPPRTTRDDHDDHDDHDAPGEFDEECRNDHSDWRAVRRELLERDRVERRLRRERARRERLERRTARIDHSRPRRRRRPSRRSRDVAPQRGRRPGRNAAMRGRDGRRRESLRRGRGRELSTHPRPHRLLPDSDMAADSDQLKRPAATRAHGIALVAYFALLPYVVVSKWHQSALESDGTLVRALLIFLSVFWVAFFAQVVLNVFRLRQGARVKGGGSAWLAGLVVTLITLVIPAAPSAPHPSTSLSVSSQNASAPAHRSPTPISPLAPLSSVPLALMAKRRGDLLRHERDDDVPFDVDESIALLRTRDPDVIATIARLAGEAREGVLDIRDDIARSPANAPVPPIVACALGPSESGTLVGFAREGGHLPVLASWPPEDVEERIVALHEGRVSVVHDESALLRALATRTLHQGVVVFLGTADALDRELAACTITLAPIADPSRPVIRFESTARMPVTSPSDLRVELLARRPSGESDSPSPSPRRCDDGAWR
jgi:hypothetical protein